MNKRLFDQPSAFKKNTFFSLSLFFFLTLLLFSLYTMYSSSEEEEYDCPLCMEELDIADRNFRPCPCGYQVEFGSFLTTWRLTSFARFVVSVGIIFVKT